MKFKKGLAIICLIVCIFCVSGAWAGDVNSNLTANDFNDEAVTVDLDSRVAAFAGNQNETAVESSGIGENIKSDAEIEEIGAGEVESGNYTELRDLINNAENNSEIKLQKDYVLDQDIGISKNLSIDGQGHKLEARYFYTYSFSIGGGNVCLKNIEFSGSIYVKNAMLTVINSSFIKNSYYYTIWAASNCNLTVINSSFINLTGSSACALYSGPNNNVKIINSNFTGNSMTESGTIGATSSNLTIVNSSFTNNNALNYVSIMSTSECNVRIVNSTFTNNTKGGISSSRDRSIMIVNSNFIDNPSDIAMGAISISNCPNVTVMNSIFKNNTGSFGGAIYTTSEVNAAKVLIVNSSFIENRAESGGAMWADNSHNFDVTVINSSFIKNVASKYCGIIGTFRTIDAPKYFNCTFKENLGGILKMQCLALNLVYDYGELVVLPKNSANSPVNDMKYVLKIKGVTKKGNSFSLKGFASGKYTVKIIYEGENMYRTASITKTFVIKKGNSKIIAKAKTFKVADKTKKYVMIFKDSKNKVIKNTMVYIKVAGKTYSAKTNSKGQATFKLTKLTKKGSFKAAITFKGNSCYNKASKTVAITVK